MTEWKCKANRTADPPQDCGWPGCGCDPAADRVLAALSESGIELIDEGELRKLRERLTRLEEVCRELNPGAHIP